MLTLVIDGPMNRDLFDLYVETQLIPTLQPGDVILLDNLSAHRTAKAAAAMKDVGAWFLFLPPYSPDLNPIEMAFAKLKALIRREPTTTYGAPSDMSATSSPKRNASTSSKQQDTNQMSETRSD
jgi:transposase